MRLEQMTVHLRSRTGWEAMELGMALVRRHAAAIFKPWLLLTLPLFVLFNAAAAAIDQVWLAALAMWWLKPAFDRIPLFVVSRATFGSIPGLRDTLLAQWRWGWKPLLHYLTWRRFGPVRSLYLPIDLLEGAQGAQASERRRVLGGAAYGNALMLTVLFMHFGVAFWLGCVALIFLFVPVEYLPEAARAGWSLVTEQPPWWAQVGANFFAWLATMVLEPFYVGAGFGLYLNRRTQIEAWDLEIALRKLRTRLASTAVPFVLLLVLCGTAIGPLRAQEKSEAAPHSAQQSEAPATPPTLPRIFGEQRADDRGFRKAADQAYRDPLLDSRRTQTTWEKRDKSAPKRFDPGDLSWLGGIATMFAFIAEWGLWIAFGTLVILLLVTARHWLPWMRGTFKRHKPLPADVDTEVLQLPEVLPDDVATEARRLWAQGRPRHALALLYRASVESMASRADVVLPPGATESECLRASRRMPNETDRSLFARMVRVWQYAAYASRLPEPEEFESLVGTLQRQFRWQA